MSLNKKTFLTKSTTIIKDVDATLGINPVLYLCYGGKSSKVLIYFNHDEIKSLIDEKVYPNLGKIKHTLRMTNTSSITNKNLNEKFNDMFGGRKMIRTASFDLIFFLLPNEFDDSRGFNYSDGVDLYNKGRSTYLPYGTNWYNYKKECKWEEEGIYSTDFLEKELDKYLKDKESIVIGYQHFNYGIEDIELDITKTMNDFISGKIKNNGIGIAFSPKYENVKDDLVHYCGFFTLHTNTFYEPYIETTYDDVILDDRGAFYLDKLNRLYFYSVIGGVHRNLDELPTCTINGQDYYVKQATKGVYYIELIVDSKTQMVGNTLNDIWSNIKYNGRSFPDVELDFIIKDNKEYYQFGLPTKTNDKPKLKLYVNGIGFNENVKKGDIRKINIETKIEYSKESKHNVDGIEYRLYVKEGLSQKDVIRWSAVERSFNGNYFLIDTNDLLPTRYYIDFKIKYDMELIHQDEALVFDIINDTTHRDV